MGGEEAARREFRAEFWTRRRFYTKARRGGVQVPLTGAGFFAALVAA